MSKLKRLLHFLFLWLWIGFIGGTVVLFGIATPFEAHLRAGDISQNSIDIILTIIMILWVVVSGIITYIIKRQLRQRYLLIGAHIIGVFSSLVIFNLFLNMDAGPIAMFRGESELVGDRFMFGPYPVEAKVEQLADQGFAGIVTLLSPLVPFEAVLLEKERAATQAAGLELIEASMLPWVSSNVEALETIRSLATMETGHYYIHCYLGRHRVDLARYSIMEAAGIETAQPRIELPDSLERGPIIRLSDRILLGPLPTQDEWFEFVVRSGIRKVISLLDPTNTEDRVWIDQEESAAEASGIELIHIPVRRSEDVLKVVKAVMSTKKRIYVHGFLTDWRVELVRIRLLKTKQVTSPSESELN